MNDSAWMGMRSWMRSRWVRAFAGVGAGLAALLLLMPYFLNVDRYRGRISDLIAMQTGRHVTLGRLRVTIVPRLGFSADGFRLSNPPEFSPGEFIRAREVRGTLAVWPLLARREIHVASLELMEPQLTFLQDDRGRDNYNFPARRRLSPAGSLLPASDQGAARPGSSLSVDHLVLREARIFYGNVDRRGRPSARLQLMGVDVDLRRFDLRPLRLRDWQAEADLAGAQMLLAGLGRPVSFDSGNVSLNQGKLESSFSVQWVGTARITGTMNVPDIDQPVLELDLKTNELDVNTLLALLSLVPAAPNAERAPAARPAGRTGTDPPAEDSIRMVARARLEAERLLRPPHTAGPLTAELRVFTDRTEVWPFTLRFADGAVQVTARTDRRQVPQRFSANVQVRDLNTEKILDETPELRGKFAGTGELDVQLVGSFGPDWDQSLTGTGQFAIRNGRIRGFHLADTAQTLAKVVGVHGDTTFTRISGDLSIGNRRIASRQIHMNASSGTLDLRGSTSLDGALDYRGQLLVRKGTVAPQAPGPISTEPFADAPRGAITAPVELRVPFVLRGTLSQPQLRPGNTLPAFAPPAPVPPDQAANATR